MDLQLMEWVKQQKSLGYSSQQISDILTGKGYPVQEVNEVLNSVFNQEESSNPKKSKKIILLFIFSIFVISLIVIALIILPRGDNSNLEQEDLTPFNSSAQSENDSNLKIDCADLPDKIYSCEKYSCEFNHPLSGELMEREILGFNEAGYCEYTEQMPNNWSMNCNYTEEVIKVISQYYRDLESAESAGVGIELGKDESNITYTINGKEVPNPIQESLENGQCIISEHN